MTDLQKIEITADSPSSFQDAMCSAVRQARRLHYDMNGLWLKDREFTFDDQRHPHYSVCMVFLVAPSIRQASVQDDSTSTEASALGCVA